MFWFLVYFTAGDLNGRLHVGVAVSETDSPYGPYQDNGSPLVSEPGSLVGAIDAHYFKDPKSGFFTVPSSLTKLAFT